MDKLKLHSPDFVEKNIATLAEIFPSCVVEAKDEETGEITQKIDFDQLRQELSSNIVEGPQERYRLDWPGKREALLAANAPIAKTLRPVREESVDFDTTKNLFIEGDNLDALKLLQETFLDKVKMIYIDPPYNTGSDFIYDDNYSMSREEYDAASGSVDEGGNRMFDEEKWKQNSSSNGRFHSEWLSMIYPRIKLARNLLADDGVMFVSIDDGESANIKRILDEVFGEQNFIDTIAVEMSTTSGPKTVNAQQGTIVKNVEFVHVYRKTAEFDKKRRIPLLDGIDSYDTHYSMWMNADGSLDSLSSKMLDDEAVGADIKSFGLAERGTFSVKNMDKLLSISESAKLFINENLENIARVDRPPVSAAGKETKVGFWEPFEADHRTYYITTLANGTLQALMPLSLNYRMSDDYKPRFGRTVIRGDLWKGFHQDMGNVAKEGQISFSNGKKPIRLIKQLVKWANIPSSGIILDFFAGSGTTAHSVMDMNREDGGSRRYVLVQLPEPLDPSIKEQKGAAAFCDKIGKPRSIAEITKERLRRAGKKDSSDELPLQEDLVPGLDCGFRVLKVDTSNVRDIYYTPDQVKQDELDLLVDHVKEDRDAEDLLFQVMLDWGVDLSLPVNSEVIQGKTVYFVDENAIAACFDAGINEEFIKELAKREPLRAVFRDSGFANDAVKINVAEVFKLLSPSTELKTL